MTSRTAWGYLLQDQITTGRGQHLLPKHNHAPRFRFRVPRYLGELIQNNPHTSLNTTYRSSDKIAPCISSGAAEFEVLKKWVL